MLNNLERVWLRAKRNGQIPSTSNLENYKFISRCKTFTLQSLGNVSNQPFDFPAGAVILSIGADATVNGQAGTAARGSLDMIRVGFDLPAQDGTLTAGGPVRASVLFGRDGNKQWPEKELVVPRQASVNLSIENLTTSVIDVDVAFNVLEPKG